MLNNTKSSGYEETATILGGSAATVTIYLIPALMSAPQPVQGAVTTLVCAAFALAAGYLPKPA